MIHVDRGPEPSDFSTRAAAWNQRFREALRTDPQLTASQFWSRLRDQIRADAQVLYKAFHGKCAFCEARMAQVSSPHIEHYRPKSRFPDLMFAWENWMLSCGRCNDTKWARFPDCDGQPCLVNPTTEDPDLHLDFLNDRVLAKTQRGERTIKLVGLDRSPLEDDRCLWLTTINCLLLLVCHVLEARAEARELLIWAMQPEAPYSAMTRSYLRQKTPKLVDPGIPHPPITFPDPQGRIANLVEQYSDRLQSIT
ncbi:MAG: HNH endonuclease [Chloroflexota bacterium]